MPGHAESSPVAVLRRRAAERPDAPAYFLVEDEGETAMSYGELDGRARRIAAALAEIGARGERVLLLYPPGLDYVAGLFGALYAGAAAVPAYPPDPRRLARDLPRLEAIARDARPRVVLTTAAIRAMAAALAEQNPELRAAAWIASDTLPDELAGRWRAPDLDGGDLALVQYTSGSTGLPRGVCVTHANLFYDMERIQSAGRYTRADVGVSWLPPYHDMGLIGAILGCLPAGFPFHLMSPAAFLTRPLRWLRAISRNRATVSVAPNFAFDLCVRKIPPADRVGLDLRSWSMAYVAAEPVRPETLDRFTAAFAPWGFRRSAFYPCYGLAEATLFVTGGERDSGAKVRGGRVACGRPHPGEEVRIVDPERRTACAEGVEGEIWVRGPGVARGYWGRPEESAATFAAHLQDGDGPFLRTGDLGVLVDGDLVVTGRRKDVIIVRGRNHHPQDIEETVQRDGRVRPGCIAAFAVDVDGEERLVVVAETALEDPAALEALRAALRVAVAGAHDLQLHEVVFIPAGSIAKTSSGKIQRRACRQAFLDGTLARAGGGAARGGEPIAIIGLACRFPGAVDEQAFWRLLVEGGDAITEVPADRWSIERHFHAGPGTTGKMSTRWGGFLAGVDGFEPQLFGITPREASPMDPQQRLLLEGAWHALEDAGRAPTSLAGSRTGVFVGIGGFDYLLRAMQAPDHVREIDAYTGTGAAHSVAANRISHVLDLRGPSLPVDTACSSSLVAAHLAVQSLRRRESDLALVGGVNLILTPETTIAFSQARMMARDGRCKTFDARADGYVRSEGCGVVVMKRLADALRDGDRIRAVVRGTAVNQDGRTPGIASPSREAQAAVLRAALADAGAGPEELGFVETHGTGTPIGDPTEVGAIGAVLREGGRRAAPCLLGSAKANVGHLECAAGMVGLIKAVLCLEQELVPPQIHLEELNPRLELDGGLLAIPRAPASFPRGPRPRLAGVSGFGFGGTNAHLVLAEAPRPPRAAVAAGPERPRLLALSARTEGALAELARRHAAALARASLADHCYTAGVGRAHLAHRLAVPARSAAEMAASLTAHAEGRRPPGLHAGQVPKQPPRIAFLFTGQGAQHAGMGRRLYETQPAYQRALDACAVALDPHLDRPILEVIFGDGAALDETTYTQPALFALGVALAELWRSLGVIPDAVLGHSIGELAAAVVAGALGLEAAARLVAARGRLMGALAERGGMAAFFAPAARLAAALGPRLAIAGENGPELTVVSGAAQPLDALRAELAAQGIRSEPLRVSHAFHSPLMDPVLDELEEVARAAPAAAPRVAFVSTLHGRALEGRELLDAAYWRRHAREPVRFLDGMRALAAAGCDVFLEIGPQPTLVRMGRRCAGGAHALWLPSLRAGEDDGTQLLDSVAALFVRGAPIDFAGLDRGGPRARVAAPLYPFERTRHWTVSAAGGEPAPGGHPLLGRRVPSPLPVALFEGSLGVGRLPELAGHRVQGQVVLPATAFLEMARAAAEAIWGPTPCTVTLGLAAALVLPDGGARRTQVVVHPGGEGASFQIWSAGPGDDGAWIQHASGRLAGGGIDAAPGPRPEPVGAEEETAALYAELRAQGLDYGPAFRGLVAVARREGEAWGRVRPPAELDGTYLVHPAVLDACLHTIAAAASGAAAGTYLPVEIGAFRLGRAAHGELLCHCRARAGATAGALHADLTLWDADGLVGEIAGVRLARLGARPGDEDGDDAAWRHEITWREAPPIAPRPAATGRWIILGDSGGLGAALTDRLVARGEDCVLVPAHGEVDVALESGPVRGIVHLWSLDAGMDTAGRLGCGSVLALAQALPSGSRTWLVTRGAQAVVAGEAVAVAQTPLLGFGRTLARERPDLRPVRVDLDPTGDPGEVDRLLAELAADGAEDELAYRGGVRHVPRLRRRPAPAARRLAAPPGAHALALAQPGRLRLDGLSRRPPGPGEIEIEVRAAGVNFRDVMNVMGVYPGGPIALGAECAGVVTAVGEDALGLREGDEVMGIAPASFATHVTAHAALLVRKPARLTFEEAATIPIAFLTAAHALEQVARLGAGERVLVHAAAGGVGLAAIQIARRLGAEVFGTAGSDEKRAHVEAQGAARVWSSRTFDYVEGVASAGGVDVVLNSLGGEHIARSLGALAPFGRFVEIGRTDIYLDRPLGLYPFHKNLSFSAVDLDRACRERPRLVRALLLDLAGRVERGELQPLPHTPFALADAQAALRYLGQRRNIGKVVLTPGERTRTASGAADGTVLITGGLGALGREVARGLAARGARNLLLVGRGDRPFAEELAGTRVVVARADVADRDQLAAVLAEAQRTLPPLRGVIHAAGVLDDGLLRDLTPARLAAVLRPKVQGAWNLHLLTRALPLEDFVLFSSVSSLLGPPGQAAYAAANAFLDGLAHHRRAQGLPALAIGWGPWSAGMAADAEWTRRRAAWGMAPLPPARATALLAELMAGSSAHEVIAAMDLPRLARALGHPALLADEAGGNGNGNGGGAPADLRDLDPAARLVAILARLRQVVADVAALPASELDASLSLDRLGLDSLMAFELKDRIESQLGVEIAPDLLLSRPSLGEMAERLVAAFDRQGRVTEAP